MFRTDAKQEAAQGSDAYFLASADRVHYFLEPGAADEATGELTVPKQRALNKVCSQKKKKLGAGQTYTF